LSRKKRKKGRRRGRKRSIEPSQRQPKDEGKKSVQAQAVPGRRSEFNPDYTYVRQDLKRIGLIAGSLVIILIVLSLILG
jgi:hypothetical protein